MKAVLAVLVCASPLVLHVAVVRDSRAMLAVFLAVVGTGLLAAAAARRLPVWTAALGVAALAALSLLQPGAAAQFLLAGPVLIFVALAWLFGRTLLAGRIPLVERISRAERGGDLPAPLVAYTRRLTWAWALLLAGNAAVAAALAMGGSAEAWSLFTNIVSYVLFAGLFFGEYAYRRWRYPQYPHIHPLVVAAHLVRRGPGLFR